MSATGTSLPRVAAPFTWREAGDVVWLETSLGGATGAFSTRLGGVSDGPYRSLNLGVLTGDERARVLENRRRLAKALAREAESLALGRQVHETRVEVRESAPEAGAPLTEADAQVTATKTLTPLVLVADCVPVLLAGPRAVAAVHCGWRGIVGGIIENALAAVRRRAEGEIVAAVGPGIGACCYEVGAEVAEAFAARGHAQAADGRLDLAAAVRRELERAGVSADRVHNSGLCTSCNPDLFFSHRRDRGDTGRQAGLVWLGS